MNDFDLRRKEARIKLAEDLHDYEGKYTIPLSNEKFSLVDMKIRKETQAYATYHATIDKIKNDEFQAKILGDLDDD